MLWLISEVSTLSMHAHAHTHGNSTYYTHMPALRVHARTTVAKQTEIIQSRVQLSITSTSCQGTVCVMSHVPWCVNMLHAIRLQNSSGHV